MRTDWDLALDLNLITTFLPWINMGIVILIIDLALHKANLGIKWKNVKKEPLKSLGWGLLFILISSFLNFALDSLLSRFVQDYIPDGDPIAVFFLLVVSYLIMTQL